MDKHSGLPNAISGIALKIIFPFVALFFIKTQGLSQSLDYPITGSWFEVKKKKERYHIPLQIQFNADSTARYINLYPEKSYNLKWILTADSSLKLSNGVNYKILHISPRLLKIKIAGGAVKRTISLQKKGLLESKTSS